MHARLKPFGHRFSYRVMSLLIDLDRLDEADRMSALFGVNRAALYSFHEKDHGQRDGSSLRAFAQRAAAAHGIDLAGGRIRLLCYPRLLGYAFNPLSVYFCHRRRRRPRADHLRGAQHASARCITTSCRSTDDERRTPLIRQQQDKLFYVSPFIADAMRYHFRISSAIRHGQNPHPGNRPRRAVAGRHLQRQAPRPDRPGAVARRGAATACHIQNYRRHPLASLASVAQRRKNCTASSAWSR